MKAIVYEAYGTPEVLQLRDVEKPAPKENEILINIKATAVNFGEVTARNFSAVTPKTFNMPALFWLAARLEFGFNKPRKPILGSEFSGVVVAVGEDVTRFKQGEHVFGYRGSDGGANAEYLCMPADAIVAHKPSNLTFAQAAAIPYGALTAWSLLKRANIQQGEKVLINGASGSIGAMAVQLAKNHFGANVTGVCSTAKVTYVEALGADKVIDYTREDFAQMGEQYDVIIDILGKRTYAQDKQVLKPNGRYLFASFKVKHLLQTLTRSRQCNHKVICAMAFPNTDDLQFLKELIESGKLTAIIDTSFPLAQSAEAHTYYEAGHAKGRVVITIS